MKKFILLLTISFFFCLQSFSQNGFSNFQWDNEQLTFSSVEMKVSFAGEPKTIIFDGYKDGKIQISNPLKSFPTLAKISIKLSGYFEIVSGTVSKFESEVKGDLTTVLKYSIVDGDQFAYLMFYFDESQKLTFAIIVATKDLLNKKIKPLSFTLKGFE